MKDEIAKLKRMLAENEGNLVAESERCRELGSQVQTLSEMRDVLQLRLTETGSGGSAAEKQVAALQMRLKVTEERLTQERSDRAGNLSQVEEKLLSENAKLQTKEKELERQLKREKEKTRSLEQRSNQFREENLQLRLAVPDEDEQDYDIPFGKHSNQRQDSKKPAYDTDAILRQVEKESGLTGGDGTNDPLVVYLWEQRADMRAKVKAWRLYLDQLELLPTESGDGGAEGEGLSSLQSALAIKTEYEAKMLKNEEKFDDISAERIASEQTYKQQLADLVKERHDAFARLKTLEDLMEALRAENEMLRQGLASSSSVKETAKTSSPEDKDRLEELHDQIASLEAKVGQLNRQNKVSETEITTLRSQLTSRDKQLAETLTELSTAQSNVSASSSAEDQVKLQRIHALTSERNEVDRLEEELEKKDADIMKLTEQANESESALHLAETELAMLRQTQQAMDTQLESIQHQLNQRCQVLDELTAREGEQLEQVEMVKGMIHSLNSGLHTKQGEIDVLQLELQQSKEKIARLEEQKAQLSAKLEKSVPSSTGSDSRPAIGDGHSSALATDLRVTEVEMEKEELQAQLLQSTSTSTNLRHELESLTSEANSAVQQASSAETHMMKLGSEKDVLQRQLQRTEEEYKMSVLERDNCKQDLDKLEETLHQVVAKFDEEAKEKYGGFVSEYHDGSPEGQKIIGELQTLRVLTFAKEKEGAVLMDKIKRQELELNNLNKKCELVQAENDHSRSDVSRITNELVLKMKENSGSLEVNRLLLREQSGLQRKVTSLETQIAQEKERTNRRKAEVNDVIAKIEHSEQAHLSTSLTLQQKDSIIGDQEVRLRQLTSDLNQTETQRDALKVKVDQLKDDIRNLSNANNSTGKKLENMEASVKAEQEEKSKQREEIQSLTHKLELLKNEQNLLLGNLTTERKVQDKLKTEIKSHEEVEKKLNEKIAELTGELETQKGQLVAARETLEQTKAQKEAFLKDYQDACRRLGEKEATMTDMRKKQEEQVMHMREETLKSAQTADLEKANTERDLGKLREEIESLKEQLDRKEIQLSSYSHTLKELEDAQRKTKELEAYGSEQEKMATEARVLIESLRTELLQTRETNNELQDTIARKEVAVLDLRDQLRSSGESGEAQVTEMRHTIDGMRSHHEYEKKALREALTKVEESLKASVAEVRGLTDQRDQLTTQGQSQERAVTELNYKLSQEVAACKVAQEKLEQTKEATEDLRKKKTDLMRQQQILESHKQQFSSKLRKLNLELKQQIDSQEKDQLKLHQQGHQLSVELEKAREALALKNKENLKLQEHVLELEDKVREGETKLKQMQDSLKHEEEMQTRLSCRFEEQESELKQLRNFLSKKADEDGDGKGMWQEMNRVISELSRQLHFHMETSRMLEHGAGQDSELMHRLRRRLLEAESQLNTERALHQVTRSSMQALEEDCARLRQTLYSAHHRRNKTERKQRSRMEEINEIIARSQTRAQAMMASNDFSQSMDATALRNLNPSRDYRVGGDLGNVPGNFSPDSSSMTSNTSYSSANLANLSFLNMSGNYGTSPLFPPKK
ncbi:interaptin-like isoform X1 [Elysia marginata]|uniref:Interaptin-like isoform X1 n=1 Tax=Elysia marginata TaxID=1093978 RepID=A0AAV4JLT1_9GAST|nr:interaptin-like isoform X1 [Elysia marginata]